MNNTFLQSFKFDIYALTDNTMSSLEKFRKIFEILAKNLCRFNISLDLFNSQEIMEITNVIAIKMGQDFKPLENAVTINNYFASLEQ